jgi:hypothetical protein
MEYKVTKENTEFRDFMKKRAKEALDNFSDGILKIVRANEDISFITEQLKWDNMVQYDYEAAMTKLSYVLADLAKFDKYIDETFDGEESDE